MQKICLKIKSQRFRVSVFSESGSLDKNKEKFLEISTVFRDREVYFQKMFDKK